MKWKIIIGCICWLTLSLNSFSQIKEEAIDTTKIIELLAKSKELVSNAPDQAINYSKQAQELSEQINFPKGKAQALKNIGIVYYTKGQHLEAIQYWAQSMEVFKSMNDLVGVSNILSNIGVIHSIQGDYEKALTNYLAALKFAEQSGNKERIWTTMNNVGATYALRPETYDKALAYYLKALPITEQIKDRYGIATTSSNIGEVYSNKGNSKQALDYFKKALKAYQDANDEVNIAYAYNGMGKEYKKLGNYNLALQFHNEAFATAQKTDNKLFMVQSLLGLANTYTAKGNPQVALGYFKKAEALGDELNALDELKDVYSGMSTTYASIKNYDRAFFYQSLYTDVKDTLYNIATNKKLASMQFDFDLQKKQGEINLLTTDKALKEAQLKRERLAKNALIMGILLVFVIAFILFKNYREKVKINKVLDRQKDEIEHLLLNILPAQVAKELQTDGHATPRNYDSVSVLFTDFKGFTSLADKMAPHELVQELNSCFMAFDEIIEKYNLEKIKTIGDSYMCAGGIPVPDTQHPYNIVKASIDIQKYIFRNNQRRKEAGLPPWDVRIGIHAGPVVAGVVGKKKYAYDIWGSTVNIASRMESNGEPGHVNISAAMYDLIKDKYTCSHRGKIYAKNVGEIDMYFVEHEITRTIDEFKVDQILQ